MRSLIVLLSLAVLPLHLGMAHAYAQDATLDQTGLTTPQKTIKATPNASGDPCPAAKDSAIQASDDIAKVQEEIDRFTLCVQRAQLLERLNESTLKNSDAADIALGYNPKLTQEGMMPGMPGAQMGNVMPPLPASALGGVDVTPETSMSQTSTDAASTASEASREWTIREISGSGNQLAAKLLSPQGDEVITKNGMVLPDGKTSVLRITPTSVSIKEGQTAKKLEWSSN